MTVPRAIPRRGDEAVPARATRRGALTGAALTALAALNALPATAEDFTGRAEFTYGQDEGRDVSSDYFRQVYLADYRRQISQPFGYRLALRYQDDRGASDAAGQQQRLRSRMLSPTASVDYRLESFGMNAFYRRSDDRTWDSQVGQYHSRTIDRYGGSMTMKPTERADAVLTADRLAYRAGLQDTTDDRAGLTLRYSNGSLRLSSENRVMRFENTQSQFSRLSYGPRVIAGYARELGPRYQVSGHYTFDWLRTEEQALGGSSIDVQTEVFGAAGLYLSTGSSPPPSMPPMTPEPGLVDRSFDTSAGISIGPGDPSFQNLGLDLGRVVTLDQLRIHVRTTGGVPLASSAPVFWSAYQSLDGLTWAPTATAPALFDVATSAYVVSFIEPTTARFFKAVNFGVNNVATFVTEMQAFARETLFPRETRVANAVRQGLVLSASAVPVDRLRLDYSGYLNADVFSGYAAPRRWSSDSANSVGATAGPFGVVTFGARQALATARTTGLSRTSSISSASVKYQPLVKYSSTLEARLTDDWVESAATAAVRSTTTGLALANVLAVYDTLDVGVAAGLNRQDLAVGGRTDFLTAKVDALAKLRRDAELRVESRVQRVTARSGDTSSTLDVPLLHVYTYELYQLEGTYHPGPQLALLARFGYTHSDAASGFVQSYRAAWNPFPGGAIQLSFDYADEIDPLTGSSLRRFSATPRWTLNSHAALQLSYNMVQGTGPAPLRYQSVYATFSLRI